MAGSRLGTVFVELQLDDKVYKQRLSETLTSTEATAKGLETSWRALGTKSDAYFDAQRRSAENAYTLIKNSASSTANDIIRAEEAKNAKIKALNEQQYGHHESLLSKMKGSIFANFTASQIAVDAFYKAINLVNSAFQKGFDAVEEYNLSVASMAAMVVTFTDRAKGMTFADQWQEALAYSSDIVPVLENIAAKTLLSGQETIALANAFARAGTFLDANNQKQVESFTRISNALPVMTRGQEIMKQINSEIRSVMSGSNEATSMMLQTLKAIDPQIESNLKVWRAERTVLENIGDLLSGFGPATALLENQWQAVKSTIDTTATQVLRGGMQGAYGDIIMSVKDLNALMEEHKAEIQSGIAVAWSYVSNTIGTAAGILRGFGPMLSDVSTLTGVIAYGWGGVFAVMKPIGEFLGNSIALTYEIGKALANVVVMAGAVATGQTGIAKTAWEEAKKNYSEVEKLSEKNLKIIKTSIGDAIEQYDKQARASKSSQNKIASYISGTARKQQSASDASTKAAEAAAKRQEAAEKQLAQELEKTIADRKKYEGTYYEWKAAEIELGLNKYREAGVSEEEIAKLRKEKLINLNAEIYEQYKKTLKDWDADTKKKHADMLAEEEKAEKEALERAERQRAALKDLYKDLGGYSGEYYAVEIALLDSRAQAYEKLLIDEKTSEEDAAKYRVAIAKWRENELVKIDIDQGKRSDDFFAGLNAHILETEKNQVRWGKVGYETFASMTAGMSSTFSTVFEDAYKGQLQSIGDYSTMIWDKVRAKYFDMVAQMIAEKIVLSFGTTWAEGGAAVLSTINKVLGLADSLDLGQYVGVNFAQGGIVQGVAAYPGNDERNDRVPAWLSPGEYIIPRTAVNADTREILDYIRSFGKAPGYALGGWVTRYNEYGEPVKEWQRGDEMAWVYNPEYIGGLTPYTIQKYLEPNDIAVTNPFHMRPMQGPDEPYKLGNETPYDVFALNVALGKYPDGYYRIDYQRPGNVDSWVYQVASNKIVGSRLKQWGTGLKGDSGGGLGGFFGAINETLGPLVPVVGQAAGYAIANAAFPILGPAALSGLVTYGVTDNIGAAIKTAGISAASAYIVQYAKEALSGVMDTSQWSPSLAGHGSPEEYFAAGTAPESLSSAIESISKIAPEAEMEAFIKSLGKNILQYSLKGLTGSVPMGGASELIGRLGFHLAGVSGLEALSMLADLNGIIGMGGRIPSARTGIDYIPRDNLIVRTHEGEAVITKEENRQRLSGRGGGNTYHFNLYATVADKKTMNEFAEQIYPRLEKLRAWGH